MGLKNSSFFFFLKRNKHCTKGRKHWLPAFPPFPTMFSKAFSNSLPNNEISDCSKLKSCAADKINMTENLEIVLCRVENIVGKGENAGYWYFLLYPYCFKRASLLGVIKSQNCVVKF